MELVVISGKGGTGKTTIAAALSELADNVLRADCDVDAPNMYLLYEGQNFEEKDFITGKKAEVNKELCTECGLCDSVCKYNAISKGVIDEFKCEGCGACTYICPNQAAKLIDDIGAKTLLTSTKKGLISRAEMGVGADGSGKLITEVRKNAEKLVKDKNFYKDEPIIIADGSPGIGCQVISSITNTDLALVVTEPTKSGMDDLKRVLSVCEHFKVLPLICINKYDLNKNIADEIVNYCNEKDIKVVGTIPYDNTVMKCINELKPITDYKDSKAYVSIVEMWDKINKIVTLK